MTTLLGETAAPICAAWTSSPPSASRGFHGCQWRALGEQRLEVGNWRGELSEGQVLALATWRHLTAVAKNPRHPGHQTNHLAACKHPLMHKSIPLFNHLSGATFSEGFFVDLLHFKCCSLLDLTPICRFHLLGVFSVSSQFPYLFLDVFHITFLIVYFNIKIRLICWLNLNSV